MNATESSVHTVPVTPDRVDDLSVLFETNGSTRRCWCMAFTVTNREYHLGWYGHGAVAIEGFPSIDDDPTKADGYDA